MQPSLWDSDDPGDLWIPASKEPVILHPGHSLASMQKPFIAWDGEGYTDEFGQHHYWLLSNSTGAGIVAPPGRSLHRYNIARLFMETVTSYPQAFHVGFALGYDFTGILRGTGLSGTEFVSIKEEKLLRADSYIWKVMMGKMLTLFQESSSNQGQRFTLYDSWGFFQTSFVKALDEYFGDSWPHRDIIIEMKKQRGSFDRDHDAEVMEYNGYELELMVDLMEELRNRLFKAGLPIAQWYGPGAIANSLFSRWKAKQAITDLYKSEPILSEATQYAYAGGRFELFKPGHTNKRVYQYDINSAYPYAIAQLPNLQDGEWVHHYSPDIEELSRFSVCRVSWDTDINFADRPNVVTDITQLYPESIPFPLWRRQRNGNMVYPSLGVEGWYWYPEVEAMIKYSEQMPESYGVNWRITEAWEFQPNDDRWFYTEFKDYTGSKEQRKYLPFSEIVALYKTRQILKAKKDGAHVGIKLGLNSLYGKLAQQIGWTEKNPRIPAYHNLAMAGWVTSVCRAMLLDAMRLNPKAIIAVETDGIFSTEPLPLDVGSGLGQWELTEYDDMYYFASGFRFGIVDGQVQKPATRGIPSADIDLDRILSIVVDSQSLVPVKQTQFISIAWAVSMNRLADAGNWRDLTKELLLMCEDPKAKRIHDPDCPACWHDGSGKRIYDMNSLHVTLPNGAEAYRMSEKHKIVWIDGGTTQNQQEDAEFDSLFDEIA